MTSVIAEKVRLAARARARGVCAQINSRAPDTQNLVTTIMSALSVDSISPLHEMFDS